MRDGYTPKDNSSALPAANGIGGTGEIDPLYEERQRLDNEDKRQIISSRQRQAYFDKVEGARRNIECLLRVINLEATGNIKKTVAKALEVNLKVLSEFE